TFAEAGELRNTLKSIFIIIGSVGIALSLIFTLVFTHKFRNQVTQLSKATEQTYAGKFDYKIEVKSKDEIGKLGLAFNKMLEELKKKEVAKNEYAEFITLINQNPSLKEISDVALKKIIDAGDFLIGGLYSVDNSITLISSYGLNTEYSVRQGISHFFKKVLETKQSLELYDEGDLPVVSTGLLDIKIKYMLFLPIVYNNKSIAVLELGSLTKPREEVRDYLEKIKDQLAIGITNARALFQLEKLVTELKQLNEDYQKQNVQIKEQNETLLRLHNELKIQAEELEKQRQKAFELTDAKSKFLANMSHELRTPMNSILGLTELMLEKVDLEPRNKERLEVVLNSGKRLMTLINDILDLSKIEAGKVEVLHEDVILEEIISEVSAAISMLANEKKIGYEVERKIDPHTVISTDRGKVVQVLINLLGNAVKYTDEGGIVLKISAENEMLNFEVVDSGIGISQEEIDVIFEEFRQSNSSKSRRRGGTGLGLAISNKLAEILEGRLDVKSEINQGSTFIFSVPFKPVKVFHKDDKQNIVDIIPVLKDEDKPTPIIDQDSELNLIFRSETVKSGSAVIQHVNEITGLEIMIVDDDPNTLFTLAEIVQEANCNPIIAHNGKECLELLELKIPDLILLDIIMPEMDGFKTIKQIKKNNKWSDIPVIAVTAKAMKEDNEIILKHGFTDYIPKPVNPAFVEHKIQQLITQLKTT
ncbi:MAG TPA: ATP-binding protein, partial [Ignavibacteriaceae bacterium]